MSPPRDLSWDGCLNVRDLGGHATEDGRTTRFGAVVRADSRGRLTDAGWEALLAYGVSRIVDLRLEQEVAADPPCALPLEVVHVSLADALVEHEWREIDEAAAAAPDLVGAVAVVYGAVLERCRSRLAAALEAVAEAPPGAVVVHCVGGKDRTGLVSALLLRLCRVPVGSIDADYAATEANLREHHAAWITSAPDEPERARRVRIAASPAGTMVRVLGALERRHGSVDSYLAEAGVDDRTRRRLRGRLLG